MSFTTINHGVRQRETLLWPQPRTDQQTMKWPASAALRYTSRHSPSRGYGATWQQWWQRPWGYASLTPRLIVRRTVTRCWHWWALTSNPPPSGQRPPEKGWPPSVKPPFIFTDQNDSANNDNAKGVFLLNKPKKCNTFRNGIFSMHMPFVFL